MKVTLITGASGGIGEAFARRLAGEKHNLLLIARSENKLKILCEELIQKHGIQAQYIAVDLTQPGADQLIFNETEKRNLQVDWLINNAGIGTVGYFSQLNLADELNMITLNITALVALTHHYIRPMFARKNGTIINVASLAAFQPTPFMTAYGASKAFVRSFTEALAEEYSPYPIRILLLCPGATETNFFDAAKVDSDTKKSMDSNMQTPEQVVEAAMSALRTKKRVTISGGKNRLMARVGNFVPNSMAAKYIANMIRPKYQNTLVEN